MLHTIRTSGLLRVLAGLLACTTLILSLRLSLATLLLDTRRPNLPIMVWPRLRILSTSLKRNHTFDNYFGTFPGADGATSGRVSNGQVVPLSHTPDPLLADIEHTPQAAQIGFDHGKMDGFDKSPTPSSMARTWR